METFRTNKLKLIIDFEKLNEKYEIFKITTTDTYINEGSYLLDIPSFKLKSIFYSGRSKDLYLLTNKYDDLFQTIRDYISIQPNSDRLSIEKISLRNEKYPYYIIGNLFLNSLNNGNTDEFKFNNLTGKLYCFNSSKDFIEKRKDQQGKSYISRITALQIKIDYNMCLCLEVKTFTNHRLKGLIDFSKSKSNKYWNSYPQYIISKPHNFLKRFMPSEKENINIEDTFILKQIKHEKSNIPFFRFDSLNKFSQSKIGMLYHTIDLFNKNYSDIIKINFQTVSDYISLEPKSNKMQLEELTNNVHNQVVSMGVRIIDCIQDETSKIILTELIEKLKEEYKKLDIKVVKKPSKNKLNLKLVHRASYYNENHENDPYSNNKDYIIQHIAIESFEKFNSSMIDNILKELIIKKDLLQNKISLIDWSKYNYQKDWIFGLKDGILFYFINVNPDGSFDFKVLENDLFSMNEYQKYINCFDNKNEIEGIIVNPNNDINYIKNTNKFTIPEFEKIHNILYTLKNNSPIEVGNLLKYINEFENSPKFKNNHTDSLNKIKNNLKNVNVINCNDLRSILKNTNKSEKINGTIEEFIHNKVYEDYNIALFDHLRGKIERDMLLSSETDIKYFELNNKQYYFVGYTGKGMRNKLTTSCCIREISALDNGEIFFKELLPLMDVPFVKYGQLTVKPFPFKYLREYIKQQKILNK